MSSKKKKKKKKNVFFAMGKYQNPSSKDSNL